METLIILFIIVLGVSFLCSILESILLSVNYTYISILEEQNPSVGKLLKNLKDKVDESIASILILNTIANTLGATAIGVQAQNVFGGDGTLIMVTTILLTFLILFVSEIIPKTIGAVYWKQLAPVAAKLIKIFVFITCPIIMITMFVTKKINKDSDVNIASREEILHTALMGEEEGIINDFESDIIENTLMLKEIKVKDILTPRSVMFAVDKNQQIADILEDQRTFRYSRVPVYDENIDNVVGVILTKKLFKHALRDKNTSIESIMKPIDSVNENIPVSKAINMITKNKAHLLLVTDNYDQTEGIVTLEDCLETILGLEIMDESDITEDMRKLAQTKMKAKRKLKEENS